MFWKLMVNSPVTNYRNCSKRSDHETTVLAWWRAWPNPVVAGQVRHETFGEDAAASGHHGRSANNCTTEGKLEKVDDQEACTECAKAGRYFVELG
jgi:hypothetical protein